MTIISRSLLVGAALLAGSVTVTQAADLGGSMKDYAAPVAPRVQYSPSSWYIRGDAGYGWHDEPSIVERNTLFETDNVRNSIQNTWTLGGGIGYYLTSHVRGDLTLDYRFKSEVTGTNADVGNPDFIPGKRKFDLSSTVGLANLYYDFGHRAHFSPYVGAGIGFAVNKTSSGTISDFDSTVNPTGGAIAGATKTDLAVALMAGFTHQFRQDLALDAGYRFLYLGKAETGAVTGNFYNGAVPPVLTAGGTNGLQISDLHAHELRVGLRYDLGGR